MYSNFIPSFHLQYTASEKMTAAWCNEALRWTWYNHNNIGLLDGKNTEEILEYASGKFDMKPYKKMFKSLRKNLQANDQSGTVDAESAQNFISNNIDTTGLDWSCYSIIPPKINSAVSIIQKIPVEISCTALDPLAAKKKNEDIQFLKNKPVVEAQLQEVADQMQVGKVDIGETKHSAVPYSSSPYGFDLNEPDELDVFVNLLYSLGIEVSFETALQILWDLKKINQVRLLETKDQFYYGVSVDSVYESSITGLMQAIHINPKTVKCPHSDLPDYSDNTHRFIERRITALEMFEMFGEEIEKNGGLDSMINGKPDGYLIKNKINLPQPIPFVQFDTFKVDMVYCEIKSVDWIGVSANQKSKKGFKSLTTDADASSEKIWGQNTYGFWWLKNTKYILGIERLGFARRAKGMEAYQTFSSNIYKSQERSCLENCIGENKKAQIADIKMQHALLKSLPAGKYINVRFIRNALETLSTEDNAYTIQMLINLAMEQNIIIGDTEGFDGKNDGQLKPFEEIAGGLKSEIDGYLRIMAEANRNIEMFSGINQALTGNNPPSPDMLVGLQKLQLNASLNSLYYATEAIQSQCQQIGYLMANLFQQAIIDGGEQKKYLINLIGSQKVGIIESLKDLPLHDMGVKITVNQREEERAKFEQTIYQLKAQGIITAADEYMLTYVSNPKDKYALLAIKEKQFRKRAAIQKQQDFAQQQQLLSQQGQNQQQAQAGAVDGKVKVEYAKGDVQGKILSLAHQLGINQAQFQALIDKQLQGDRQQAQIQKNVETLQTKAQLENQKAVI